MTAHKASQRMQGPLAAKHRGAGPHSRYCLGTDWMVDASCAALMYTPPLRWHSCSSCSAHARCMSASAALCSALPLSCRAPKQHN